MVIIVIAQKPNSQVHQQSNSPTVQQTNCPKSPTAQEPNRPNSTRAQQGNRPTATRAQQPQEPNSFKSQAAQEPSRPKSPRGHYYSLLFSALKLVITLYFGGYSYFVLFLILIFYLHYPLIIINNLFPLVIISYYV